MADELKQVPIEEIANAGAEVANEYITRLKATYIPQVEECQKLLAKYEIKKTKQVDFNILSAAYDDYNRKYKEDLEKAKNELLEQEMVAKEDKFQNNSIIVQKKEIAISKDFKDKMDKKKKAIKKKYAADSKNIRKMRDELYALGDSETDFKNAVLKSMSVVLKLRAEMTQEVEEELGITYSGFSGTGIEGMYLAKVKMSDFLDPSKGFARALTVGMQTLGKVGVDDPYELRFQNSVLRQMIDSGQLKGEALGEDEGAAALQAYRERIKQWVTRETGKYVYTDKVNGDFKAQSGFVAEAVVERFLGLTNEIGYEQDTIPWYSKSDITGNNTSISLKNAMGRAATLVRINSVKSVLERIHTMLSTNYTSLEQLRQKIISIFYEKVPDNQLETFTENFVRRFFPGAS